MASEGSSLNGGLTAEQQAGLVWKKAEMSKAAGACVEVARASEDQIAVRDSKHPDEAMLVLGSKAFAAFKADAQAGNYDYLLPQA